MMKNLNNYVANVIGSELKKSQYTQSAILKMLALSADEYADIITGSRDLDLDLLSKISFVLQLPLSAIVRKAEQLQNQKTKT